MLDVQKGEETQNNSFTGLGMQFPLLMYMERLIYLVIVNSYFFVLAWGSMRNQEFHKGVDGPKSLGTPDLEGNRKVYRDYY